MPLFGITQRDLLSYQTMLMQRQDCVRRSPFCCSPSVSCLSLTSPLLSYHLLLIAYPGQALYYWSDACGAVPFLHVFFSLCLDLYSYFTGRCRNSVNSFLFRSPSTWHRAHTTSPHQGELALNQERGNKLTLQQCRKSAK